MPLLPPLNRPICQWNGQRVWIIGASRGIGAAVAQRLASLGAHLYLSSRDCTPLNLWHDSLPQSQQEHVILLPMDIENSQEVSHAAQKIHGAWEHIDLVLIAAGVYDALRATDFCLEQLPSVQQTIGINLLGPYHVLAAILPRMRTQRHGHVAIISSVAGYNGLPRALAYAPSKAALNNLCEGLYFELRPLGIGISRICPGFVATDMTAQADYTMPALISADDAANEIIAGLARGAFEIHFPRHFTFLLKVLQWLPRRLYFPLLALGVDRAEKPR
ncbi:MAG: SDR family NAD(P)-dependent oxidoreductase [Ferrovum sp.]|nr:SDR family NAD(P)-dependent oxidoreductase [Ferrovum sp.]NDU87253.1 SDR family NAD(P)-dependent oxidoreductase [Ferrovum sp.]